SAGAGHGAPGEARRVPANSARTSVVAAGLGITWPNTGTRSAHMTFAAGQSLIPLRSACFALSLMMPNWTWAPPDPVSTPGFACIREWTTYAPPISPARASPVVSHWTTRRITTPSGLGLRHRQPDFPLPGLLNEIQLLPVTVRFNVLDLGL